MKEEMICRKAKSGLYGKTWKSRRITVTDIVFDIVPSLWLPHSTNF